MIKEFKEFLLLDLGMKPSILHDISFSQEYGKMFMFAPKAANHPIHYKMQDVRKYFEASNKRVSSFQNGDSIMYRVDEK